jgi:cold shock protein
MGGELVRGTVKFFKPEKGWGGIQSVDAPGDVWVHCSVIEMPGFRTLTEGQEVEFRYQAGRQDSWNYRATWVRPLAAGTDPTDPVARS